VTDVAESSSPKRSSSWNVETDPGYARAWLASLAPVDNLESAREIYQSLYAMNRVELDAGKRFDLLELYREHLREITGALQSIAGRTTFPMPGKPRRFVEFVCQLHLEMAQGYKTCVLDLPKQWLLPWRRRQLQVAATEHALTYLGQALLRAYQFYLPTPAGVWRDAHALYRLVEHYDRQETQVAVDEEKGGTASASVSQRYRRLLMLGIANPYQMPLNEALTVYRFLERWIGEVNVDNVVARSDHSGCFLIDPKTDAPPVPLERAPSATDSTLRVLDTTELIRTLRQFVHRLERGDPAGDLDLGVDCLDANCHDMLQRLLRMYSQTVSRRHSRIKRHETVSICAGISALHFFASGQKTFGMSTPGRGMLDVSEMAMDVGDEAYVELGDPSEEPIAPTTQGESYRVDRWQVRDLSPQGLLLAHDGKPGVRFRVGDLLGIQRANVAGQWSVGLVRWVKATSDPGIEAGIELIAPEISPGSIRAAIDEGEVISVPALLLPAIEAARKPASVLIARGAVPLRTDLFVTDAEQKTRRVRVLELINRTSSVEQAVIANAFESA
jgi:hypothetical protein